MPDDQEKLANLTAQVIRFSVIAGGLGVFASKIVARGRRRRLTAADLDAIKAESIRAAKNTDVAGLSIDTEANILRQALQDLEQFIDGAIAHGGKAQ